MITLNIGVERQIKVLAVLGEDQGSGLAPTWRLNHMLILVPGY